MVLCFTGSVKKHFVAKILLEIWERFLYENNRSYTSNLVRNSLLSIFSPYIMRIFSVNSIDVYKRIFLHVIHVFSYYLDVEYYSIDSSIDYQKAWSRLVPTTAIIFAEMSDKIWSPHIHRPKFVTR